MSQPALRQPVPVGKYFLDRGKITPKQLELALQHRAEFGLKLGQSLVELGLVTEADMVEALRHQARFPCIHLTSGIVDARIANKVGESVSRRLKALALNQIAGHTTVALEDPSDVEALQELQHILATRIFPVYAEPSAIQRNLERVFGPEKGMQRAAARAPSRPAAAPRVEAPLASAPSGEGSSAPETDPDERAVVERVRTILQQAFEQGVRSIHLEARAHELVVRFRGDGGLRAHTTLSAPWARPAIACLKSLAKLEGAASAPQEGVIPFTFRKQPIEVNLAITPSQHGESATLHVRRPEPRVALAELGLGEDQLADLEAHLVAPGGLGLVVGPAESGHTLTLRALLARLATTDGKVVSLAPKPDPELATVLQIRPGGAAGLEPASALRACLRQDPDVLFVHEVGERETARGLLEASLEGRKVFCALHASSAIEALARMMALGLEPYLLADVLRVVVAQRRVRRICADCSAPIVPDEVVRARLGLAKDGAVYHEGEGCTACNGTGYREHLTLFEVMGPTPALRRELEKGGNLEALARAARIDGFRGLREHGLAQARAGLTTLHEVLKATGA